MPYINKQCALLTLARHRLQFLIWLACLSFCGLSRAEPEANTPALSDVAVTPQIAIVIDDLGYSLESGRLLSQLPYPLTLAIIPNTPHAKQIAGLALDAEQEVILHVPMEPKGKTKWEEGLSVSQPHQEFTERLNSMLNRYPEISGINNHGGSLLTANLERMNWVMEALVERELYFLDSRTTSESQAITAAEAFAVENISRDVFLDNIQQHKDVAAAFQHLREIARKHGSAVAIGHPYNVTIEELLIQLPKLIDEGFELTYCSHLVSTNKPALSNANARAY